jgi:2-methylcitrate dehydratase PrpD
VTSVLLARRDYAADPDGLEGDYGSSAFHGDGNYNLDRWRMGWDRTGRSPIRGPRSNAIRAAAATCALDAADALIAEHAISIDVGGSMDVHPDLLDIVRFHKPTEGFRGKFSIDYVLAAMLLDHRVDLNSFSDDYCNAPRMRAALEKVAVNAHPEWPHDAASRRKSPVTITMKDGRTFTRQVEKVRGSPGNPMTRDELVEKYRGCAGRVLGSEKLERSIAILETLETIPPSNARR